MNDILTNNGDPIIKDGDFVLDKSDLQDINYLLQLNEADLKYSPLTGVGINRYINAPLTRTVKTGLEKKVRLNMLADSFQNVNCEINSWEDIKINGYKYE